MRLATIVTSRGLRLHVRGRHGYVDVGDATADPALTTLSSVLAAGADALNVIRGLQDRDGADIEPGDFGPAVPDPPRILCLGVNYGEHAIEGGREVPSWPESFLRGPGSVLGPYADLIRPALTDRFDYEGELGVVIATPGRYVPAGRALDVVAGFVVVNDATARDWQRAGTQWTAGKNFEASLPIGPEVVTPDEVDVSDLALTTTLNGTVMQSARTSQMIVDVPRAIEFLSSFTMLRPGDVIATGTPGGVGFARKPPVWLLPGDLIEVEIEGIGAIANRVVAEDGEPADWRWRPAAATPAGL